jgi:hypothetical protein
VKTIGIITANYNRPSILSIWCAQIIRLREDLQYYIPAVVVSEESDKAICDHYHINHLTQQNIPVSAKFNTAMLYMHSIGVDYVCILGSDDIISTDTFRRLMEEAEKGYDLIGINSIYFFATDGKYRGQMVCLNGTRILGVCKTISAQVLNKVYWQPWTVDKNWGLDSLVSNAIKPYVTSEKILSFTEVYDLKSKVNINKSSMWVEKIKKLEDPQKLWNILGKEETKILKKILG